MKKIIEVLASILLSLIGVVAVLFLTLNTFKSPKTMPKIAKMANYYEDAYPVILGNIKNQVGAIQLQNIVEMVITKKRVTDDINIIINNGNNKKAEIGNKIKEDLTLAFKDGLDKEYEEDALTKLVSLVGNTYQNSLFPNEEYEITFKVINKIPMITIIFISTLVVYLIISLVVLIFVKSGYKIVALANFLTGFILVFPYLFVNVCGLFKNFYYTNIYWTAFIKKTIYFLINAFGIAGLVFLVLGIIVIIMEKIVKKEE